MELQIGLFSGENPQVSRQHPQVSRFGDRNKTANEPIRKLVGPQVSRPACSYKKVPMISERNEAFLKTKT